MLTMDSDVRFAIGVGPVRAKLFNSVGVHTVRDLLAYYPRDYDFVKSCTIADVRPTDYVCFSGKVTWVKWSQPAFRAVIEDDTGKIRCSWFNMPHVGNQVRNADRIHVYGRAGEYNGKTVMTNPKFVVTAHSVDIGSCVVTYPAKKGLPSSVIAKVVNSALDSLNLWI